MKLNAKQLIAIACAVLLFSLSELFPPWLYEDGNTSTERSAGYHHSEPPIKSPAEMKALFALSDRDVPSFSVYPDLLRLYGQRIALPFLLLGGLLLLRDERPRRASLIGTASLAVGLTWAVFVILLTLKF
jgi:hypothetical protein